MNDRNPRFMLSAAFFISVFSIVHFAAGYALISAWMNLLRGTTPGQIGGVLVNLWWCPSYQIYPLFKLNDHISRFAFPIANSLLWGAVIFVIWKVSQGHLFRFSMRTLLLATTLVAVLLGAVSILSR
jgi:hypothetical protein